MEHICRHNECDGILKLMPDDPPWDIAHYMCPKCYSTYCTWVIEQRDKEGKPVGLQGLPAK